MSRTVEADEAFDAWHTAKREFRDATPWTADWLRLRMVEAELRSEYLAFVDNDEIVAAERHPTDASTR